MKKSICRVSLKAIIFIIFAVVMIAITIFTIPIIKLLPTEEGRLEISKMVEGFGFFGTVVYILMVVLQIVVAIIPGEPFEIIGGMLFGNVLGTVFCLAGAVLGTILVFFLVKIFGEPLVELMVKSERIKNSKILNDEKKLELLVFLLFLVPGTPKDALTYIVPLTKIEKKKYFIYSTLGRFPSIITSVMVGASIGKGRFLMSVIIFLITGLIGLIAIAFKSDIFKGKKI